MSVSVCEHVTGPDGMVGMSPMPGRGQKRVVCPCCGIGAVAAVDDDLTDPPMLCPYCDVQAVEA